MADQTIDNMSVTWNSGGTTFNAIKMNVTNTASAGGSLLMDLQVGGVDLFTISKAGLAYTLGGLKLKQSAAPAPTGEGELEWNSTANNFAVGDGANTLTPGKPPTQQVFSANGTWTKPAGCRYADFEAVGGGGGSGGVNGIAGNNAAATAGGGSGFYGRTGPLDVSAVASAAVTIGAGGAGGAAGANNGVAGGNTQITISAVTYIWGGGQPSSGLNANGTQGGSDNGGAGGGSSNLIGGSWPGGNSIYTFDSGSGIGNITSGAGGGNPMGSGGAATHVFGAGVGLAATAGGGHGGGASGSGISSSSGDSAGGAGSGGYMRVTEYY